ncbi:MAG: caspase domain-containing protein, partial [Pseudomonadota bacterium]
MNKIMNWFAAILAWIALSTVAHAATDERRVALVIGNGEYTAAQKLPNPGNDSALMSKTLRDIGFEVIEGRDLSRIGMIKVIDEFTERAFGADVALIFYAGHGMQVDGKNYMIPVDAELDSAAHLKTRTIAMDSFIDALPSDPGVGILIIDACRNNPLARAFANTLPATRSASVRSGLAPVQTTGNGAGGLLIGFATDPDAEALDGEGENSPYTTALARHIATPGLNIHSVLTRVRNDVSQYTEGRQRPWYNASLGREIFLGGPRLPGAATPIPADVLSEAAAQNQVTASGPDAAEKLFWEQVASLNSPDAYKLYQTQYPNGHFSALAAASIVALSSASPAEPMREASTAPDRKADVFTGDGEQGAPGAAVAPVTWKVADQATQKALGLNKQQRRELQLRLRSLSFDPKGVDGSIGPNSRRAIS